MPFLAFAMVHPSNLVVDDAKGISVPVALLPSNGEDPAIMDGFWDTIKTKSCFSKCVRKDFVSNASSY